MSANRSHPAVCVRGGDLGEGTVREGQCAVLTAEYESGGIHHRFSVNARALSTAGDLAVRGIESDCTAAFVGIAFATDPTPVIEHHGHAVVGLWRFHASHPRYGSGEIVWIEHGDLTGPVGEQHRVFTVGDDVTGLVGHEGGVGQLPRRRVEQPETLAGGHQQVRIVAGRVDPQEPLHRDVGLDLQAVAVQHVQPAVVGDHQRIGDRFACLLLRFAAATTGQRCRERTDQDEDLRWIRHSFSLLLVCDHQPAATRKSGMTFVRCVRSTRRPFA